MYRLDRTAFKIQRLEDADQTQEYWLKKTPEERLAAAWYLTCYAFGIDPIDPPAMDKSHFLIRKHDEERSES